MREAEPLQTVGAKGFATYWYKLWTTNCVFPGSTLLMQESVLLCPLSWQGQGGKEGHTMLRPNQPSLNSALLLQGTETREAKMQISRSTEKDNQGRLKAHNGAGKEVVRGGTEVKRSLDKFFGGEDAQAGGVVGSEVRQGLSACATVAKPAGGQ